MSAPIHSIELNNADPSDEFLGTFEGFDIYRTTEGTVWAHDADDGYRSSSPRLPSRVSDAVEAYENLLS